MPRGDHLLRCDTCDGEIRLIVGRDEAPCFDPDCDGRMHPVDEEGDDAGR